jgi:hypothetical protein
MRKYRTLASEYFRITGSEPYGRARRKAIKRGNYGQASMNALFETSCKISEEKLKSTIRPELSLKQIRSLANSLSSTKSKVINN